MVMTAWFLSQLLLRSQTLHPKNALPSFNGAKGVNCEGQGALWFGLLPGHSGHPCLCIFGRGGNVMPTTGTVRSKRERDAPTLPHRSDSSLLGLFTTMHRTWGQ